MWRAVQGRRFTEFSWHCSSFFFFFFLIIWSICFFFFISPLSSSRFFPDFFLIFFLNSNVSAGQLVLCSIAATEKRRIRYNMKTHVLSPTFTRFSFSPALLRRFTREISFATIALFFPWRWSMLPVCRTRKDLRRGFTEDCLYLGIRGRCTSERKKTMASPKRGNAIRAANLSV